jgi:hypothetical protein
VRRLFAIRTFTLVACGVVAVALVATLLAQAQARDASDSEFTSCPATAPDACASRLAKAWNRDVHSVPSIHVPAGMRYAKGFITKHAHPPTGYFTFETLLAGDSHPSEVTVSMTPASSAPFDAEHRGGKLTHLRNGHAYLDGTVSSRSGPFIERVGNFDVVVGFDMRRPAGALRPQQLLLLASVTPPQ